MRQTITIFESPKGIKRSEFAKKFARKECYKFFQYQTEKHYNPYETKDEFFKNVLIHADPYLLEFLRQTEVSVVFDRKYATQWIYDDVYGSLNEYVSFIDNEFAKLGTNIIFCYNNDIDKETKNKYIHMLNTTACKSLAINLNNDETDNMNEIRSFISMHQKLMNYRDVFYDKTINCSHFIGRKILFLIEGSFDYLTKEDIAARLQVKDSCELEALCNKQFRQKSDEMKLITRIMSQSKHELYETSIIPIRKFDLETISKQDFDLAAAEIMILMPDVIVTFSKTIKAFAKKLHETRFSKILYFDLPTVYTNEIFDYTIAEIDNTLEAKK